jgi:hypothetical protein
MTKEQEIMRFLHEKVFDPILNSPAASEKLKQGVRLTIMRMEQRDACGMVQYYWSAITGTERSIGFAKMMKDEGFTRFEEPLLNFERNSAMCGWHRNSYELRLTSASSRRAGR